MSPSGWQGYVEEHVGRLLWGMVAVWTILVGASWLWNLHQAREFALDLAKNEAQLSYNKDLAYRLWGARHGGVYVPVTPQSPPNPYLAHLAERDILTPAGRALTLVNPAYMTRQVQELATRLYGTRGHLTSLKPLRPENAADDWEAKALESFETGGTESIEVVSMAGQPYMRLIRPWRTEQACLKCHAAQGYKVGDIRGGISVAVPLQPYLAGIRTQTRHLAAGHGLIWLLGVSGIFGGGRRLQKQLNQRRQAEAKLAETLGQKEEALALLDAIFDSAPIGLGFWDRDLRFVRLNQALADINGYPIQEHLGKRVDEISLGLEDPQGLLDSWRQILETGEPRLNVEVSSSLPAHPAEKRAWLDNWFPVRRGDEIIGLAATVTDITERQRAEAEIQRLASFPQLNPKPVLEVDANGIITYANQAALEALQQLAPEAGLRDFLPKDWEEIQQATRETGARNFEREVRIKDTVFSEVIAFAEPFNVWRVYASDITERQRAEAALRESQGQAAFLADLLESSSQPFGVGYIDGRLGICNAAYAQLLGYSKEEFLRLDWARDLTPPEWQEREQARLAELHRNGQPVRYEKEYWHKDGHRVPVELFVNVRLDEQGQPLYYYAFVTDITERRQAEEALRRSNQRLNLLAESAGQLLASVAPQQVVDAICLKVMEFLDCQAFFNFLLDENEKRLHLNAYAGIPAEEAHRIEWLDYGVAVCGCAAKDGCRIVAEDIQTTLDTRTELVKSYGIQAYACHPLTVQGRVLGTLSFGTRTRTSFTTDELALMQAVADQVAIAIDRKRAEEALQQARDKLEERVRQRTEELRLTVAKLQEEVSERLQTETALGKETARVHDLYNNAPCGYHSLDASGRFVQINDTELAWLGYSRDEVVGRLKFTDLVTGTSQESFEENFPGFKARGWVQDLEYEMVRKDGTILPVLLNATAITDDAGNYLMSRSTVFDLTARQEGERLIKKQNAVLAGVSQIFRKGLECETAEELGRIILTVAAEVTGARFGFIAEISSEDRLNILASSDPGWSTGRMGETGDWARPQHLEIRGLYQSVIQQGQTLIANNPDFHPDSLGVPAGHPPLTSFLGVPLWRGEQVVGLIGLGNKAGGFEEADQKAVETQAVAGIEALSRLRAETKAGSIGRLYRLLSRVNETIVRAPDRESLFDEACRIAVEEGGFRLAWIGLLDQENQLIKPTAQYGFEQGYLEHLVISVADVPESRGPTGVAVREGKYDVCNNFATDPRMAPWRQRALERGYRSSAAFPLQVGAQVVGAMTLYAERAGFFTEAEIGLLGSLAQDLSFALESMDREAGRRAAAEEIRRLNAELEERVQERTAELARAVENLEKEMAGRVKAEEALQRAIADLQIVNQELQAEIMERQAAQDKLQISLHFLEVVHQNAEINSLLEAFVAEIKAYTGCEAVGIRVLNAQAGIPYLAYQGFSQEFYELESPLNLQTDRCMCINVIKGSTDPNLPFYTPGGSFYMNGTTRFLATVAAEDKGSSRNMCNQVGYESVALIPFRRGEQILGLIHVADKAENMVPLEMVEILEKAGMQLGSAFQRLQAEAALRESEAKFRSLFDNMTEGVALHEMIFDRDGRAVDYRILAVNPAFEKHTGLSSVQLQGQPASQVYDSSEAPYLEIYAQVARSGQPHSFETFFPPLQRHFHISATSPKQGHFVTVFEDITARKEMEEALYRRTTELSRVVTDLEQKNAEMERFTYMISHDLKSPLVTISTFLGYLKKDMASADTGRIEKDMQYMRGATDKMGRLLAELLEMSRIGRVVNQPVKVTFQELVEEALNAVAGPLAGRGLEVQVSDSEVTLCGDRPRLVEIWQNLVENAVKFMGEQSAPRLEIGFQRQGDDVVFFVCDNGIGVDPRYQSKIFGIFEKLNASIDGTGIGLAFVKRIVEIYKGTIWVESAGQGQGACFRFTLPGAVKTE